MKKSVFTYSVSIAFLTILLIIISVLVKPIINVVSSRLNDVQNSYIALIEESLGVTITYESLSPSILSGLRMVDIEIINLDNKTSIVTIDSIKLRWNILKLLSENPTDALGKLIISGVNAEYNAFEDNGIIQKILNSTQSSNAQTENIDANIIQSEQNTLQATLQNILNPLFIIPIDIQLVNTSLSFVSENFDASGHFSKIELFDQATTEYVSLLVNGTLDIDTKGMLESIGNVALNVSLDGRITESIENSFAQLRILSSQGSDYIVPRFDFHASYEDNAIDLVAMQNLLPFSIKATADFTLNQFAFNFSAKDFEPFDLVTYRGQNQLLHNLLGSTISGTYNFQYKWDSQELEYDAVGSSRLSSNLIGESILLDYEMFGNGEVFTISHFDVLSDSLSLGYSGNISMQTLIPEGIIDVRSITVPSGESLSTEIYLNAIENELLVFASQIFLGEKVFTAFQLEALRNEDSLDFNFEISDYSRAETSNPGVISANGSYDFGENKFLQVEVLTDSVYLASIFEVFLWYLPEEESQSLTALYSVLDPYIFSFNTFFSSNFDSFSYSLPYAIIANTQKDDELLLFSVNGNESLFQMPSFNLLVGGQSIQAEASGDLGDGSSEVFFNSSVFVNSIPYTFSGVFLPNEYITISGDYNVNVNANFLENNTFSVLAQAQSLPISISNFLLSLSFDTSIMYNSPADWFADVIAFEVENIASTSILNPRVSLAGSVNTNGAFFDRVVYADDLSTLNGILASSWNSINTILQNLTFNLSLADSFSNEKYELNLEAFNLSGSSFADDDFLENMFFSADALIQDSPSARFASFQTDSNTINAQFTAQGSLENPSANLFVENASFLFGPQKTVFSGSVSLEDYTITANDVDIALGEIVIENIRGGISVSDLSGSLDATIQGRLASSSYFAEKTFNSPVNLSVIPLSNNDDMPLSERSFKAELVLDRIVSSFIPELENYSVELIRTPGMFELFAGIDNELTGTLLDSGEISLQASDGFFVQFDGFGIIENDELTMVFDNILADASDFSKLVDLPFFSLHSGIVDGTATLTGPLSDLQINGNLKASDIEISVPAYVNERLVCADFPITVTQNIFSSENALFVAQDTQSSALLDVELSLEQLLFTYVSLNIKTFEDEFVLGHYFMPYGSFSGLAEADLFIYVGNNITEVRGNINVKDTEAEIKLADDVPTTLGSGNTISDVIIDLYVTVENQSQLYFPSKNNPIIRGLVNQTTPLLVQIDSRYGTSLISGEFDMRGGEILYLNRTFFIREASAVLDETIDSFDPRLTAIAEIRERDTEGENIRILLSVENQHLKQLDPAFESIPSMSEQEIMTLLGQVFLGSSEELSPIALLGGFADYWAQLAVFRGIENNARDLLNVDIFSLRTMFLQNAILNEIDATATEPLSVGDILDSTTVYVGKFFNETLYADAMFSLVYDEEREDLGLGGLVFQPEFGLELPSPFATIRMSVAPDLTTDWDLLVPFTSISFSWKFDL